MTDKNNWRCGHGWLRGEQCEICNAPKRKWVGLTDEDRFEIAAEQYGWEDLLIAVETKLKGAQHMTMQETLNALEEVKQAINLAYASGYSAGKQQRPWQGLTYEEIESAISDGFARGLDDGNISNQTVINYVRGIEAKLKELNNG